MRTSQSCKSVEARLEVSTGCLVLNYDVDKTLEDRKRYLRFAIVLYHMFCIHVGDGGYASLCKNNQRNVRHNCK